MDTIGMNTYGFVAGVADATLNVFTQYDRRSRKVGEMATRPQGAVLHSTKGRQTTAERALCAFLRTPVRCAIIGLIAQLSPAEIPPPTRASPPP